MEYTYILKSKKDGKMYTGITCDLRKRFKEHNGNFVRATKNRGPFQLIYYEACLDKNDSAAREKFLKSGMGKRYIKNRLKRFLPLTAQVKKVCTVRNSLPTASEISNGGYIALTSVIIVSLLLLTVITALSSVNYFSRYNVLENEYKDRSFALAEACLDYSLAKLIQNSGYAGNETVALANGQCKVRKVCQNGTNRIVYSQGEYQKSFTNFRSEVNPNSGFAQVSWQELPNDPGTVCP